MIRGMARPCQGQAGWFDPRRGSGTSKVVERGMWGAVVCGEGVIIDGCSGTRRGDVSVAVVLTWDLASQRGLVQEVDDGVEGQVSTQHKPSAIIEGET